MGDQLELYVEEARRSGGLSTAGFVSIVIHALLIAWFVRAYEPVPAASKNGPIARYVELIRQNPREFVEAPGREVESAPLSAPLSDANRRASIPEPTGDRPTQTPGDGRGLFTPPMNAAPQQRSPQLRPSPGQQAEAPAASQQEPPAATDTSRLTFHQPTQAAAGAGVDWRSAIREVGKVASLGGAGDIDLGEMGGGGDRGSAEQGPLSFETQWYDWGAYAQSMVAKIRVHWYANMPQLIRTGMKGVVTIRFTIMRDGRIEEITVLQGSGAPPYDFAARKAIELASPLNPLPKDFPKPSERVTAMFFYNSDPKAQ